MTRTIQAVYERGVLRLKEPVALADRTTVEVTITTSEPVGENETPAEILSAIASLPNEGDAQPFVDSDLERRFKTLVQQWRLETMKHSNPQNIIGHDLYYEVLTLGKAALPLILQDLKSGGGFWFLALRVLAKPENPVKEEHLGDRKRMTDDWLEWGRQHGYLVD